MKFYQVCCLVYLITNSLQKLILSNTLGQINHLDIFNDQINLTIWMQIRYPFYQEMDKSKKQIALRISDQDNQNQLQISIFLDQQRIIIEYDLQNQIEEYQQIDIQNKLHEWMYVNAYRNVCFDRLFNNVLNMTIKCNQQFNASLFTFRQEQFQILIYDQMEFTNQEILLFNIAQLNNFFNFNILKNDLKILFYVKYDCNLQQEGEFYAQIVQNDSGLRFYYSQDNIYLEFTDIMNSFNQQENIKIHFDQWLFFYLSFSNFDVRVQFTINNQQNELIFNLDKYLYFYDYQKLDYFFNTRLKLKNSKQVRFDSLLLINNIEQKKNHTFCYSDCKNCVEFICQDQFTKLHLQQSISHDVQLSNYFLNNFPNNYEYYCTDKKFQFINDNCCEWPKYYGEYCFNCQYYQIKQNFIAKQIDLIQDLNYFYYFESLYYISEDFEKIPIGLQLEYDLNIFIFNTKDIYMIYKTEEKSFCEDRYVFKSSKCVKKNRKCQLYQGECMLCQQNYSIQNQKCIRCQNNCLFCRFMNKRMYCLLFVNNYFQDEHGLLKQCQQNMTELVCQEREEIIQNLSLNGHNICQLIGEGYTYDPGEQLQKCQQVNLKVIQEYLLNYRNQIKIYQQKLEIQDMMLLQQNKILLEDSNQINLLIYHQQINKLSQVVEKFNKKSVYIKKQQNFEYLSKTKQIKDNIDAKRFVFYDVQFFLGDRIIIQYQNQSYSSIISLYENIQIDFSSVQFDILFIPYERLDDKSRFRIVNDIWEFYNVSFILNLTFQINPSYLSSDCVYFSIQANEIIINNLLFENFDQQCQSEQFELISDYITINNMLVFNSNLNWLFSFKDFKSLKCSNIRIIKCKVEILFFAEKLYNQGENSTLELKNIMFLASQISQFIQIYKIKYIEINQITYKDTILKNDIIQILDYANQVMVHNIMYDNVTFEQSISINMVFIYIAHYIKVDNITIYNTNSIKSKILSITNVGQIFISQIHLKRVSFYQDSQFLYLDTFIQCEIEKISFKNTYHNQSSVFKIQNGNEYKQIDIYFMTTNFFKSGFINSQINYTNITNFNIQDINLIESDLIIFQQSYYVYLYKIHMKNFEINNQNKDNNQINIQSNEVVIEDIIFKNFILNNSNLINIQLYFQFLMKNLQMTNVSIINEFQNQLILIKNPQSVFFNKIRFEKLKISSQSLYFCVIKFMNIPNVFIQKLFLNQIKANLPSGRIAFIDGLVQQLEFIHSEFFNIFLMQIIKSKSQILFFNNLTLKNATVLQSVIFVESFQFSYDNDIVSLYKLKVFNITGSILEGIASKFMITYCKNIMITNYQNSMHLFKLTSNKNKNIDIYFTNTIVLNQGNTVQQSNKHGIIFLFQSPFNILIRSLYVNNTNYQILFVNQTQGLDIIGFYIYNSYNQIMKIISESISNNKIKLNFVKLINVTSQKAVFDLEIINNVSSITLSNLLLKNVSSQMQLFNSDTQIKFFSSFILGGSSKYIFNASSQRILIRQSLISNINQLCILSESKAVLIQDSEIVDNFRQLYQLKQLNQGVFILKQWLIGIQSKLYKQQFVLILVFQYKYENLIIDQQQLILYPEVNIINNLVVTLNPFHTDKHIKLDLNCNQDNQIITYRTLIKTFKCQLGEYLHQDQCQLCDIEKQLYSVGYNQGHCQYIDTNKIEKLRIGQIKLYSSYWRHSLSNKYIEVCQSENCLGGWKTGDISCQIGYIGAICSECDINNTRGDQNYGKIDGQCKLCYFDQTIYLKALFLIIYQLVIMFSNQYTNKQQSEQYLFIRIAQRKFTEILLRQNINQATIILKLYYNYLFTIFLVKESIYFGYYVNLSLNIIYNPNLIAIPQFDCLIHSMISLPVQYAQLLYKIIMPVLIFNIFIIIYIILIKVKISRHSIYIVIVCLITIFQQNQFIILQSLIRLLSKVQYSNIFWTLEYMAIQFYSQTHQQYLTGLIIPLSILFIIINIIMFYWIKFINKRIYNNLKLSLLIQKQYKNGFYFWEYIRITFIYLFMVIIYNEGYNYYVIILILTFCCFRQAYSPFVLKNLNQIDSFILLFSIFSYFVILTVKKIDSFHAFIILIFSNLVLLKIILRYFFHGFNHQFRQSKMKFMILIHKFMPCQIKSLVNLQNSSKVNYHYSILKYAYKKSNNSLGLNIDHTYSKSKQYSAIEIELSNLNIK